MYELQPVDIEYLRSLDEFGDYEDMSDEDYKKYSDAKLIGLQGSESRKQDIELMKNWHKKMQTPEGRDLKKKAMNGEIHLMHNLVYGAEAGKIEFAGVSKPFNAWIQKYGMTSRDSISVTAVNQPIGSTVNASSTLGWAKDAFEDYGFLMQGYPSYVSDSDLGTETLTSLPDTVKKFNKNSGQVKRPAARFYGDPYADSGVDIKNWRYAQECILDNWKIIGIWIGFETLIIKRRSNGLSWVVSLLEDAENTGLPVYLSNKASGNNFRLVELDNKMLEKLKFNL